MTPRVLQSQRADLSRKGDMETESKLSKNAWDIDYDSDRHVLFPK
jgi:hypothetical protein